MKTPGRIRKLDDLGRIVIPADLRKALELDTGDALEMYVQEEYIVMRKFAPGCIFCGGTQGLMEYKEKNICAGCLRNLRNG